MKIQSLKEINKLIAKSELGYDEEAPSGIIYTLKYISTTEFLRFRSKYGREIDISIPGNLTKENVEKLAQFYKEFFEYWIIRPKISDNGEDESLSFKKIPGPDKDFLVSKITEIFQEFIKGQGVIQKFRGLDRRGTIKQAKRIDENTANKVNAFKRKRGKRRIPDEA